MTNNDVFRRLRYIFDLSDSAAMDIFAQAEMTVSREQVCNWLKKDDDPDQGRLKDVELASFLNGFINARRGKKEGAQPQPESRINNNIVLRKLKIALDLQAEDLLALVQDASRQLSKHELSAFFRKEGHKHYRECHDQVLRNVLSGLQKQYRGKDGDDPWNDAGV